MYWINLAQDNVQRQTIVSTVANLDFHLKKLSDYQLVKTILYGIN
jgi:hypothetical protein